MRAQWRWVAADLRAHARQAILTAVIVAAVVAWLVLAAMLLEGASSPWLGLYDRTGGPDVVVYLAPGTPTSGLAGLGGVREASQAVTAGSATLMSGGTSAREQDDTQVELRAMPSTGPAMLTPLVVAGSWLSPARPNGIVVEASFAAADHLTVGSEVRLDGPGAGSGRAAVTAEVTGIAETSGQIPYPQWTPGLTWVSPALLGRVDPRPAATQEVIGLRLDQRCPVCVTDAVDEVSSHVQPQNVEQSVSWQQVSQAMAADGWLLGELLALFGLIALAAAACAIANVTAARAVAQRQSTAMLKAIGFTPRQVAGALLGENLLLAAAGTLTGLALAWGLSRAAPASPYAPGGVPVTLAPLPAGLTALIAGATVLAVAIATVVQAWRAARVPVIAAVMASPPRGKLSRLARVGLLARFPAPLILGARDAFTRRALAALTIAGVAIPMALAVIALASWTTIDGLAQDPGRISIAALTAYPHGEGTGVALSQIKQNGSVRAAYPGAQFQVPLPGQAGTFTARAMGTTTSPYPFRIVIGQLYHEAGEAVASQRLLAELGMRVGDSVWVTINGVPVTFQIVGEAIDPAGDGDVLDFPVDALSALDASPQFYSLVLAPGASPARVAARLQAASAGRLDVQPTPNPADGLSPLRLVIVITAALLAVLGLANLVTATRAGLRDHLPEAGVLAAIGLTPAQVTATFIIAVGLLAAAGVLAGTIAGLVAAHWLINAQAAAIGLGWGIEPLLPGPGLLLVAMAVAITAGTATALLVVRRSVVASHSAVRVRRDTALAAS
ncbi:MAG TPA: FtsX-like permease family protein [Trebonia sp.]|nr:FtsX-like permease family protein [Trebonia sp.]